jgi:hypothetical protein
MKEGRMLCTIEDESLREDIVAGFPLLSTCRQIYQEAAITLFSNNTWIVSRDAILIYIYPRRNGHITEAAGAAQMLQMFGSRRVMVKRILLDLDGACPVPCISHRVSSSLNLGGMFSADEQSLEVWALMTQMLLLPNLTVEFIHPKRRTYYDVHPQNGSGPIDLGLQLELLNTTLQTLRKDPIGIRKYGRQVRDVYIGRGCTQGHVIFNMLTPYVEINSLTQQHFVISDEGRTFTWSIQERMRPTFTALPHYLKRAILNEVSFTDNGQHGGEGREIIWDMDKKTLNGASLIAGAICHDLRACYYQFMWWPKDTTFRMSTSKTHTDFGRFQALEGFTRRDPTGSFGRYGNLFWSSRVKLLLEFNTSSDITLEDIRLNLIDLLRMTNEHYGSTKITVSITGRKDKPRTQVTTNLWFCRTFVLSALSDAGRRYREIHQNIEYPTVWMNGRFEVVEVDFDNISWPLGEVELS